MDKSKFQTTVLAPLVMMFVITGISGMAHGWSPTEAYKIKKQPKANLLKETSTLALKDETSIQRKNAEPNMFVSVLAGYFQPTALQVASKGPTVQYDFQKPLPLFSAQFTHYPFEKWGRWGWMLNVGYSYSQYRGAQPTALHLVPIEAQVTYRLETQSTQKVIPYFMAGPSLWTYFQRGIDQVNTSATIFGAEAGAGLVFNLNRLGLISGGRTNTEALLQYKRSVSRASNDVDWNGNTIQAGASLAF